MNKSDQKFNRYEFKYILDPIKTILVRDFIKSVGLKTDPYSPKEGSLITSLYFDTFGLDDYYDKQGGFLDRKKVRARIYGHDLQDDIRGIYLEVKNKHDMFIFKDRIIVSKDEWQALIKGEYEKVKTGFVQNILKEGRVPSVLVRYKREAFEESFLSRTRITLDSKIEAIPSPERSFADSSHYDRMPVLENQSVLEIKFSKKLPWWFSLMTKKFNLSRTSFSKYTSSVNMLYKYNPLPQ